MERRVLLILFGFLIILVIALVGAGYFIYYSFGLANQSLSGRFEQIIPGNSSEEDNYNFAIPRVAGVVASASYDYEIDTTLRDYNTYYPQERDLKTRSIAKKWSEYLRDSSGEYKLFVPSSQDEYKIDSDRLILTEETIRIGLEQEIELEEGQLVMFHDGAGWVFLEVQRQGAVTAPISISDYSLQPVL